MSAFHVPIPISGKDIAVNLGEGHFDPELAKVEDAGWVESRPVQSSPEREKMVAAAALCSSMT